MTMVMHYAGQWVRAGLLSLKAHYIVREHGARLFTACGLELGAGQAKRIGSGAVLCNECRKARQE